jgi:AcrR family transcriptional regulator
MTKVEAPAAKIRGSKYVKAALIAAATELLGEVGPRRLSVREVAERAQVNHGQVHHYFGGKRGLLEAAMRHLGKEHFEHSLDLADGQPIPPALSLTEDQLYFRAVCQAVMDDDLDLVMAVDGDDEISVPRRVLRELRARHPDWEDIEVKARFSALAATQLGWVAFEELLSAISEITPDERDQFRQMLKNTMEKMANQALE